MDGVEAARQHAAGLHTAAVARGVDPWRPLALVLAEVEFNGLAAEPTDPAASQLDGALATFLPEDGLILYGDGGTEFEQAFLVAHELGHALLGDGGGGCDIDPDRSAEAAPVGEERVVEHGPRQRREAQMDLFARELLLPRHWVRDLHLADGLTATTIAQRLGAPRNVVAQQLLDALLLPTQSPDRPSGTGGKKLLNERQKHAVRHRGPAYLLEAGPGTGKTQTLTARVADLLAGATDPRRILVLTFSNKAAGEMSDRIAGGHADAFAAMWIGTFHAFGLDLLHAFGDRLGLSRKPGLLSATDAVAMLEDELPRLGLKHYRDMYDPTGVISDILAAISRAKDEVRDAEDYSQLADGMLRRAEASSGPDREAEIERAQRAQEVAAVYSRYEAMKLERDLVDFGDLVMLAVKLLEDDAEVARIYRGKYAHVLVDEYQDVNRASVRLLKALRPGGAGLWAVGDGRQSIYRFRGASSRNMALFRDDFPGAVVNGLVANYRSSDEIVGLFSHFAKSMAGAAGGGEPLMAERGPSGDRPQLRVVRDKLLVSAAIADAIEEHRAAGGRYRDNCVLVSGNDRLAEIGGELESLDIPVLFLGSLFERPEIKELLCLLSLLSDRRGMGLVRTACMTDFGMSLEDVANALQQLRDAEGPRPEWLENPKSLAPYLSDGAQRSLAALAGVLKGFDLASHPWEVLSTILVDRTRMAARIAVSSEMVDRSAGLAIWQFMNFLKAQRGGGLRVPVLLERVRRLLRLGDERDLRQLPAAAAGIDAVRLMTIHGSKGLEFPVVHLPGLNDDTMPKKPHTSRPRCPPPDGMIGGSRGSVEEEFLASHTEEQDCIFYVAMSRAEDKLRLYSCSHQTGGRSRKVSPFIARLGTGIDEVATTPLRALPGDPSGRLVPVRIDGPATWPAWQLDTYEKCPRRFFYTHVLRVGGSGTKTAYVRVHDAVRDLCRSIVDAGGVPDDVELERLAHLACDTRELADHGYLDDFKRFAAAMVTFFGATRRGLEALPRPVLSIDMDGDRIEVVPDDVLRGADGHVVRSVRTGHYRKGDQEKLAAKALVLAANEVFPTARVQILHLADGLSTDLELKKGQDTKDRSKLSEVVASVRAGRYSMKASPRVCPNCPALLVCDALPPGSLTVRR